MLYRQYPVPETLAAYVACFWTLSGRGSERDERILPDGSFELVFHFGDPFYRDGVIQPRTLLIGEIRRPTIVRPFGASDVFGVRFRPGGAAPFFRMPMDELRDQIVDCADVLPGVRAEIEDGADHKSRVAILTRHSFRACAHLVISESLPVRNGASAAAACATSLRESA